MVLLEAMATGCPVVATDVGGVNMAVKDRETGYLVNPHSPRELANAIIRLLEDAALSRLLGGNGNKLFKQRFIAEKMASEYEKLYLA